MAEKELTTSDAATDEVAAVLAEYADPDELLEAAGRVRDAGYRDWDTHTPYPLHGLDRAIGIRPTVLPWFVLGGGVFGAAAAIGMQWWMNAIDYPYLVSGKPLFSLPANIPIAFELVILFAALAAFLGVFVLNRLPQFWHPAMQSPRFDRMTTDRFFLSIEASDPQFDEAEARRLLESTGALAVEVCRAPATGREIPTAVYWCVAIVAVLALLPPLGVAWYRSGLKRLPRIHPILDMDSQPKYQTQGSSPLFADGRASRPPVAGTIAVGELDEDTARQLGKVGDQWVEQFPVPVSMATAERGQSQFNVYCAPCHGLAGEGDGIVAERARQRAEPNWVPPLSLHAESVRAQPVGQLYNTVTNGIRSMPGYGSQIPVEDRWAIVLYLRALQRSQHATLEDVPPEMREQLR